MDTSTVCMGVLAIVLGVPTLLFLRWWFKHGKKMVDERFEKPKVKQEVLE